MGVGKETLLHPSLQTALKGNKQAREFTGGVPERLMGGGSSPNSHHVTFMLIEFTESRSILTRSLRTLELATRLKGSKRDQKGPKGPKKGPKGPKRA